MRHDLRGMLLALLLGGFAVGCGGGGGGGKAEVNTTQVPVPKTEGFSSKTVNK